MAQRRTIKRAAALREYIPPRTNWQDVGRDLRRQYIARVTTVPSKADQSTSRSRRAAFLFEMIAYAQSGDPSALGAFLRSGQKLTQFDRNELANLLEAIFTRQAKPTKQRGRSKRLGVRACAAVARRFHVEWKDANRRNGINDWGHGDEMKDEACRLAIELYVDRFPVKDDPPITFEEIRELMERPAARRG